MLRGSTTHARLGAVALAAGAALVACSSPTSPRRGQEAPTVSWHEPIEVARGGGQRGPWRMNESAYDFVDDPTVAIDARGAALVAWVDQARKDVLFQVYEPDGAARFARPVNVSRSPTIFSWLPRLVIGGDDGREVYVLWQEIVFSGGSHGGEIFFARSADGGRSFDEPVNLSRTTAGAGKGRLDRRRWDNGSFDLVRCPEGHLYAAWTEYEGALWVSRSTDGGATFAAPHHVAGGDDRPARGPALAVGAAGAVHLAWTVGEDEAADIHLASSSDHGRSFGAPAVAVASRGAADAPKLAVDGDGVLHLVHAEQPAGPRTPRGARILYTRAAPGTTDFAPPRDVSHPLPEGFTGALYPSLDLDRAGRLYVLWELVPDRAAHPAGLGFAFSGDGGRRFTAPSLIPGTAAREAGRGGGQQGLLMRKLAVADTGAIVVVHSTFAPQRASRVRLHRGQRASE
jgi:hypothetical protein